MKIRTLAAAAAIGLRAAAAQAQEVTTDYDKDANFTALKTFSIQVATGWGDPLGEKRALAEFEEALAAKGWTKTDPENSDAQVMLHGATEKQKSINSYHTGMGGSGPYFGNPMDGRPAPIGDLRSMTSTIKESLVGTLVVDIFDAKSKELVFRGTVSDALSDKPEKTQKKLDKASRKMFKDFPPGSKEKK